MSTPASILVAYASVGAGYRLAAEAVAQEIRESATDRVRVELIDVLDGCSKRMVRFAEDSGSSGPARLIRAALAPAVTSESRWFAAMLTTKQPAAVLSTHPHPTLIASRLASHARLRSKVVSVPTHFDDRDSGAHRGIALHCASSPAHVDALARAGVAPGAIALTGIPVRTQFTAEYDTTAARDYFGLPNEGRVVLAFAASGDPESRGSSDEALFVALPALASLPDTAMVVIAGDNVRLAAELTSRSKGFGTKNVKVLERVEHVAPLIACADLVLTRPTGLVCAECVDSLIPLVLVGPENGRERATAAVLAEAGAAVFVRDPSTLSEHVSRTLASPAELARMRDAATGLARPFAALDIAERALALAGVALPADPSEGEA